MTQRQVVRLKNGAEELRTLVAGITLSLRDLMETDPIALYELRELCRDRDHELLGDTKKTLQDLSLVDSGGRVHKSIRNVVLSAIQGEMLEMRLTSPLAE